LKSDRTGKRLLIVSYHFPPDAAVGSIRPAKFAKYLHAYGWASFVLTVKKDYYERLDPTNTEEVKEIFTSRTIKIPTIKDIYLAIKNLYFKKVKSRNLYAEKQKWVPQKKRLSVGEEGIFSKIHRYFNSLFVWLPDDKVGWVIPASIRGLILMRQHEIDAILTTGPPHSVHLIGMILKVLSGKPWITDFRDPWSVDYKPFLLGSEPADAIERWLIRKVVERSDCVVSVTEEISEMFRNLYQDIPKEKFYTIWNGFDSDEMRKYSSARKYSKFTITYAGTFYFGRNPMLLLSSLSDLIKEGLVDRDNIQVQFIGNCRYVEGRSVEQMIADLDLGNLVIVIDQIPHSEALKEMAKSHSLLVLAPDQPLQIPAKVFEYMGLCSPILSVCGEGATKSILRNYPLAIIVEPNNSIEMKKAIMVLLKKYNNNYKVNNFPLSAFERRNLTERLAMLLDRSTNKFACRNIEKV
jgi:hypothetical protein